MLRGTGLEKELEDGGGKSAGPGGCCSYGVAAAEGWRNGMEDAHLAAPEFDVGRGLGLFGVFDGHGGSAVAKLVAEMMPAALRQQPAFLAGKYGEALTQTFLHLDTFLASRDGRKKVMRMSGDGLGPDDMGCTAVVALVRKADKPEVHVANAGDSRCVLVSGSTAVDMSRDHSPALPDELKRIQRAGGFVTNEGRVNGNLNLSRALGDLFYKKNKQLKPQEQLISGVPEVRQRNLDLSKDRFLILACDGIWERASSQAVTNFLLNQLQQGGPGPKGDVPKYSVACGQFLDKNVSKNPIRTRGLGCDNMTLMLVDLLGGSAFSAPAPNGAIPGLAAGLPAKRRLSRAWMPPPSRRRLTLQLSARFLRP